MLLQTAAEVAVFEEKRLIDVRVEPFAAQESVGFGQFEQVSELEADLLGDALVRQGLGCDSRRG